LLRGSNRAKDSGVGVRGIPRLNTAGFTEFMSPDFRDDHSLEGRIVPLATAILLITLVGLGISITVPLLSLEMERMGVASSMAGINTATAGLGNILIVPFIPRLAQKFGANAVIIAAIATLACAILLFKLIPDVSVWFFLRFIFGAALGALFTLSEYWINSAAPSARRGLVMGIYATALSIGFALGPALLALFGTVGWQPYIIAAIIPLMGAIPLVLFKTEAPALAKSEGTNVFTFMLAAPAATMAALVFGAIETAAVAHLPVLGVRGGYPEGTAAAMVSLFAAGNIVSQVPIGMLADRMDKTRLLLLIALSSLVLSLLLGSVFSTGLTMAIVLFALGGIVGALYTVGLSLLGARYSGIDLANANAAFVILYSSGLMLGPPFAGFGIDLGGVQGFTSTLALILVAYAAIIMLRPGAAARN
jgi:MFS family permease